MSWKRLPNCFQKNIKRFLVRIAVSLTPRVLRFAGANHSIFQA